ncbi:DPP7 [Cordylochernes scorpioides]|uniref:DPP7 n=1 Tax=Cordylochernes scorpioides TaxID=51811 RepID=A0ABY6K1Z8_9ARAC|nr:DPP7 [Cordylochernes scorpioides]
MRYYGKSLPFGAESFTPQNIGWLSIDQALADYASLLVFFEDLLCVDVRCPVITFGGSYGGMLSAFMRYKFPNLVDGAIAASAPIFQVAGVHSGEQFFQAVTKDFRDCAASVQKAFNILDQWYREGPAGICKIQDSLGICHPVNNHKEYRHLLLWIRNAFVMSAMMDYPYPTDFMGKFPAYPVKEMCKRILSASDPVCGLRNALELTYNSVGTEQCFDTWKQFVECSDPTGCGTGPAADAWDYQCCTEMNLEGGSNGQSDMFPNLPFNKEMRDFYCMSTWKVKPRRDWLRTNFWGCSIHYASNIIFSNGDLDPWSQGGVLHNVSGAYAVWIEGGAHHLDLRSQNPNDPYSVINARRFHQFMIQTWLNESVSPKKNKRSSEPSCAPKPERDWLHRRPNHIPLEHPLGLRNWKTVN